MQEVSSSTNSQITPALTRDRFIEIVERYLEHGQSQNLHPLLQISPSSMYQLLAEYSDKAEEWLFYPIFRGINPKPGKNDNLRYRVLVALCRTLQDYQDSQGVRLGQQLLKTLLQKNVESYGKTVLHVAAQIQASPRIIAYLLQLAARLKIVDYVNIKSAPEEGGGTTALFYAAQNLQLENMKVLLEHKASVAVNHSTWGSLEDVLTQKAGDTVAAEAMALLASYSKKIEQKLSPYKKLHEKLLNSPPSSPTSPRLSTLDKENKYSEKKMDSPKFNNGSPSKSITLTDVIKTRLLFKLASSKDTSLATFIAFLQQTSTAFASEDSRAIKRQFLFDFDSVQTDFVRLANEGVLNLDNQEQIEIFAVAVWLMGQKRFEGALALFQRLIYDKDSIFLTDSSQMFKLLSWSAICIGEIHQQTYPKSMLFIQTLYIEPIKETENASDLLTLLDNVSTRTKLPQDLKNSVARLLDYFLKEQNPSLSLLQSGAELHSASTISSSSPVLTASQSTGNFIPSRIGATSPAGGEGSRSMPLAPRSDSVKLSTARRLSLPYTTPGVGHFTAPSTAAEPTSDSKGAAADQALAERILLESATQTESAKEGIQENVQSGLTKH